MSEGTEPVDCKEHSEAKKDSLSFHYMVTIKCNHSRFVSVEELDTAYKEVLSKLKYYELSDFKAYELDSLYKLHMHFLVTVYNKAPYYKRFTKQGWTVHFQEYPESDSEGVHRYLEKVSQKTENICRIEQKSKKHFRSQKVKYGQRTLAQ